MDAAELAEWAAAEDVGLFVDMPLLHARVGAQVVNLLSTKGGAKPLDYLPGRERLVGRASAEEQLSRWQSVKASLKDI